MSDIYDDTYMQDTDVEMYNKAYQQGFQEALTSNGINIYVDKIKADAIDEFMERIQSLEHYKYYTENKVMDVLYFREDIKQIAEQLKEKANE